MSNQNSQENIKNLFWGSVLAGLFGALGGAENSSKLIRRIILPLFLAGIAWQHLQHIYIFSILLMFPVLSIGYGIPDENDEGSPLGRFFMRLFKQNNVLANIATRGFIEGLLGLTLSPIALIKHNYIAFVIGVYIIKSTFAFLSWQSLGYFEFQGKKLIFAEFIPYAVLGAVSLFLIYF